MIRHRLVRCAVLLAAVPLLLLPVACQSMYYGTMEAMGKHKRDLLVTRVQDARDTQEDAKQQFQTALDAFSAVVEFDGGDLRATYDTLQGELDRCEEEATAVRKRIKSVEDVSGALFEEWERELDEYTSDDLRRKSEQQLAQTRVRYHELTGAMWRAEETMEPVLVAFRDQVLYLKHNLNAQAIASLRGEVGALEADIAELVREMEAAIAEANEFIATMGS